MNDEKVPEKTKEEMFAESPDDFIHVSALALAITRPNERGQMQVLLNSHTPMEIGGYLFMLQRHCTKMLDAMAIKKAQDSQIISEIAGKKNFRNFIRRA